RAGDSAERECDGVRDRRRRRSWRKASRPIPGGGVRPWRGRGADREPGGEAVERASDRRRAGRRARGTIWPVRDEHTRGVAAGGGRLSRWKDGGARLSTSALQRRHLGRHLLA